MIDHGKKSVLGVLVDAVDYDAATQRVLEAARESRAYGVSALAVHGVMTGVQNDVHRGRLNALDLVTADGQPVRWALNWLHRAGLTERVYGPELTLRLCRAAAEENLPVYFYGSTAGVLEAMQSRLRERYPALQVAGAEPSRFRGLDRGEKDEVVGRIRSSGARITFVGLGCPRQEVFTYEIREALGMPVVAVGAAFDYHAGLVDEPPQWMQDRGLQWSYRLLQDPARLWRRYVLLNPAFVLRLLGQKLGIWHPDTGVVGPPVEALSHG